MVYPPTQLGHTNLIYPRVQYNTDTCTSGPDLEFQKGGCNCVPKSLTTKNEWSGHDMGLRGAL